MLNRLELQAQQFFMVLKENKTKILKFSLIEQTIPQFTQALINLKAILSGPVLQREKAYSRTLEIIRPLNLIEECCVDTRFHQESISFLNEFQIIQRGFDIPCKVYESEHAYVDKLVKEIRESEADKMKIEKNQQNEAFRQKYMSSQKPVESAQKVQISDKSPQKLQMTKEDLHSSNQFQSQLALQNQNMVQTKQEAVQLDSKELKRLKLQKLVRNSADDQLFELVNNENITLKKQLMELKMQLLDVQENELINQQKEEEFKQILQKKENEIKDLKTKLEKQKEIITEQQQIMEEQQNELERMEGEM
ncbi:Hypothetical_protein [Hexamita inflata]|uniref:Hypothetical_protein n=2 Tax=Hexamita inflata TaxID=28002 RepID=A0AA86UPF9_9EUKA|nr:Hypothetical protein HINF_LOCUS50684 [Hexamita inflata]